jgi:ketosteroid isomerase-like protein
VAEANAKRRPLAISGQIWQRPCMSADLDAVRRANQDFYQAFESLDLERMSEVWAHEGQVTCAHPGWPLAEGWIPVKLSWETIFENTAQMKFSIENVKVDVRGELAWVVCVERMASDRQAGALLATNVFRRDAGRWLMVHHHASGFVAAPVPPPSGTFN